MKIISENYTGPWMSIGDFNDVITSVEKLGGRPPLNARVMAYRDMVNHCNFLDMGFTGPLFTWFNDRQPMSIY